MNKWIWAAVWVAWGAASARAEWQLLAELSAGGGPKELALERHVRVVQIECTEGAVQVETLWVQEGEAENPIPVAREFQPGQTQAIDLGGDRPLTGIRIGDGGAGKYKVSVQ